MSEQEPKHCRVCGEECPCADVRAALEVKRWGQYTVVRVGNAANDEWTNVGVIVFGADGRQAAVRLDTLERAIQRGDWQREWAHIDLAAYVEGVGDVVTLNQRLERVSHAMSVVQCRQPYPTLLSHDVVERLYATFVTGERP